MAAELDIIDDSDLEAPLKLAENYKKLANDFNAVVASTTLLVNKMESQDATIAQLTQHTKQLEKEVKELEKANKKAAKSTESMAAATELADDATGGLVTRTKALGKQLWALVANPVVATLAAIVAVLGSVAVYFKSTNEGADKFERILAAIGAVGDFITNKIAKLGEQIVKLFEDGNVLGEAFMWVFNRILNTVSGVIDTFTNLLRIVNTLAKYNLKDLLTGNLSPEDVKELNKAFVDLGNSAVQAITGIGTAAEQLGEQLKSIDKLVQENQKLGDELRDRILGKAKAELEIEKLLFKAKDKSNNTDQQRLDALKQAVKLSEDQLKIDLNHADRKEKLFTADLLHKKGIITTEQEANKVLAEGTTILQDQRLEQLASDKQLEERRKLQADVINLQRTFFAETKKSVAQIAALEKEITDEMIKQAEIQVRVRLKAYDEQLAKSKEISGREILGVQSALEQEGTLRKNFSDRLLADAEARHKAEEELEKKRLKMLEEKQEKERIIRESAIVAVGMIGDEFFNRKQEQLAFEAQQSEQRRQQELDAAGDDERKKLAINRKFDREQAKIKTKQAQADKQAAIFGIIINTALGIMKASPSVPLMVATGILGAIQLALVASKPLPKFAAGTDYAPDTFIAGERGRELVQHRGKMQLTKGPTLFTGMEGAKVFSNPHTEEILGNMSDVGYAINYGTKVRRVASSYDKVAEGIQENNKWLKRIATKEDVALVVDEDGFHSYSGKVARRNKRLDKRFFGR